MRLSGLDGGSLFLDLLVVIGLQEREPDDGRENKGQDGEDHAGDAALRGDKGADGVRAVPQVELDARDGGKRDDLREDVGHDGKDDALKPHRQHQQGVPGDGTEDDGLVDVEDAGHDAGAAEGLQQNDYLDARAILNWNADSASLVAGSKTRERMNEYKTHLNWAKKTVYLSEVFGITE